MSVTFPGPRLANSACPKCQGWGECCNSGCERRLHASALPLAVPHPVEACYGSRLHCHEHGVDESQEGYRYCLECGHMFVTAAELLAGHNKVLAALGIDERDPAKVFCCPHCVHDF